ncbi:iron ABC transporter [Vibrio caribbeanicus]|uniref:Iron ABC transporter n=1 Tax=Vibrio caribbeanicus TaxID=701175 RepID=A0ACC4P054_9VIBR|nr:ABC transporter ATP-binding protein [Vibrio caribbeanicus]KHD26002.1 iron ABC transporter [Vibrio caribbeanicus]
MNAINILDLTVRYSDKLVLDQVSCAFKNNHLTALIGANGCGKSTLLKTINGNIRAQSGQITLADGQNTYQIDTKLLAKRISMLPQTPITPEGVTVKQLVSYGRAPYLNFLGQLSDDDKEHVDKAMKLADISDLADRSVSALSGGQRQRAWIAMVLAQDTETILLDEPTTYLDMSHQYELLDIARDLVNRHGKTVIVVLHDLNQACRYADQLVIVHKQTIYDQGSPKKVFTEQMLSEVFNLDARVIEDPESKTPMAIPRATRQTPTAALI